MNTLSRLQATGPYFTGLLTCLLLMGACGTVPEYRVDRALAFARSTVVYDSLERQALLQLKTRKLYLRFYQVIWDQARNRPDPIDKLNITPTALEQLKKDSIQIIPSVLLTNDCLKKISPQAVDELGERINYLLAGMLNYYGLDSVGEVQIDCNWTAETREKYFALLQYLKPLPLFINNRLTATLQLHHVRQSEALGVPPVNRGMLYCGLDFPTSASNALLIPDTATLKEYRPAIEHYALPLDITLRLADEKLWYREKQLSGVVSNMPDAVFTLRDCFRFEDGQQVVLKDTLMYGWELKTGDRIRSVKPLYQNLREALRILSPALSSPSITINLLPLDSSLSNTSRISELENLYLQAENRHR